MSLPQQYFTNMKKSKFDLSNVTHLLSIRGVALQIGDDAFLQRIIGRGSLIRLGFGCYRTLMFPVKGSDQPVRQ